MSGLILDLFAGPGGWSEGLSRLGLTEIGIEWDAAACRTAKAAGHLRVQADVAAYPTEPFVGKVQGLIASPPCQAWSMAGKRNGERDRLNCHALAERMARHADDSTDWTFWEDGRSSLVCQPVRWVRDLMPEWIALEQVPPVLGLWQHFARIFGSWGYFTWVGVLNAANYGVPQTRQRAFLIASQTHTVAPPPGTHCRGGSEPDLFGDRLEPWVSMASALGWGATERPMPTLTAAHDRMAKGGRAAVEREREEVGFRLHRGLGMTDRHGQRPDKPETEPSPVITSKARTATWTVRGQDEPAPTIVTTRRSSEGLLIGRQLPDPDGAQNVGGWKFRNGTQQNACSRSLDEPAGTLFFGHQMNDVSWIYERPATTVCADPRLPEPDYRGGRRAHELGLVGTDPTQRSGANSVRVTVAEASVLQSFRPDYPWQGSRTKQFEQIGNAVPPLLAAHVLAAVAGVPLTADLEVPT